jgi:hypothetical protein
LCVPLFQNLSEILKFTPRGAFDDKGISTSAEVDQRYARWISALFLKKEGQKLFKLEALLL